MAHRKSPIAQQRRRKQSNPVFSIYSRKNNTIKSWTNRLKTFQRTNNFTKSKLIRSAPSQRVRSNLWTFKGDVAKSKNYNNTIYQRISIKSSSTKENINNYIYTSTRFAPTTPGQRRTPFRKGEVSVRTSNKINIQKQTHVIVYSSSFSNNIYFLFSKAVSFKNRNIQKYKYFMKK